MESHSPTREGTVAGIIGASSVALWFLVGFAALFFVFQLCVIGVVALLSRSPLFGTIAWYQLGAANLLAAYFMGRYLWRAHHPAVEERWMRALESR